jgi:hypothetical protein
LIVEFRQRDSHPPDVPGVDLPDLTRVHLLQELATFAGDVRSVTRKMRQVGAFVEMVDDAVSSEFSCFYWGICMRKVPRHYEL